MAGASRKKKETTGSRSRKQEPLKSKTRSRAKNANTGNRAQEKAADTRTHRVSRKKEPIIEEDSFMGTEVAIIASFAISVLLFLSNFKLCGAVGNISRGVLLGIFGIIGYIAPILMFIGTCFYLSNRGNRRAMIKMASVLVVLLSLCGLTQMMFGGGFKEGQKIFEYYKQSAVSGTGGGLLGGFLVVVLCKPLGGLGAGLILFVSFIIGCVCITEKSLVSFVKKGSGCAYQYARKDMNRRRILHEEKKVEKKRLRDEQKVRGVNFNATSLIREPDSIGFASECSEESVPFQYENNTWNQNYAEEEPELTDPADSMEGDLVNPADLFVGKIALPENFVSDDTEEREQNEEPKEDTKEEVAFTNVYIRRDTRTLEEMQGEERVRGSFDEERPIVEEVYERNHPALSDSEEEHDSCLDSHFQENHLIEEPPVIELKETAVTCDSNQNQEDEDVTESADFFIPEEAKTVVTASGKVIDTDTELVRKKMEVKREERTKLPVEEQTVAEQIELKNEIKKKEKKEYIVPPMNLLKKGAANPSGLSEKVYRETAIKLQQTLQNFGVGVTVTNISCGPSVTRYELHPEQGVKVSKIVSLSDDIKLNLAAADIRIEAPIPGKAAVGIEVPNKENTLVLLRDLLESDTFKNHPSKVAFAVGKDIAGQVVVTDVAKMPHLLIAGATGSGKSVCINTLIMSVIYKADPEDVKLIMIDPKVVELSVYNGIPHLLIPVVTDPKKASGALNWAVAEMTDRYKRFAQYNVRDLKGYNAKINRIKEIEDENKPQKLPQIIIIVDELADLMMVAPGEVEDSICRLAQLARAAGIHLVIATQRPSVNVITGLIKANIPSRIAFSVSSGVDSRTIIDMNGAEKLLGKGDMLFYPSGMQKPQRVQGAFVSDQEVSEVVEFLTKEGPQAEYNPEIETKINTAAVNASASGGERDVYFVQAGRFIIEKDKASIGMLQRMFKIGFNRAARIMDQLAEAGVVGEEEGTKPRKVLITMEQFENMME